MKKTYLLSFVILLTIVGMSAFNTGHFEMSLKTPEPLTAEEKEKAAASEEAFDKMMQVLTHKRCVNCHPSDDYPRQGEDSHVHRFGVQRGEDNHGVAALRCETCHQSENNALSGVPGAPEWHLAPKSMAWQGLSRVEIAKSMLNPENNGGRNFR